MCCILNQLDVLQLFNNPNIGDEGARALIPCLEFIAGLGIGFCRVSDAVMEEIKAEKQKRPNCA